MTDEQAIRDLVKNWLAASKAGDTETLLSFMTDDIVFMVPGHEPFGKNAFKAAAAQMKNAHVESSSDIREIKILGDWAYIRNYLDLKVTTPDGNSVSRKGYTLTILQKGADGAWRLSRDANLLEKA